MLPGRRQRELDFWEQIVHVLPTVDSWIVGGDFDNVKTCEHWWVDTAPALLRIARCERDAWDMFLFTEGLDTWHVPSFIAYATDPTVLLEISQTAGSIAETTRQIYVFYWIVSYGGIVTIWPCTALLDHAPILPYLRFRCSAGPRRGHVFQIRYLRDASLTETLSRISI